MIKEKDFRVCLLLEYYGNMLTDRQREVIELYYNEDLSLQEISEHVFITRQGVRDLIVRGERVLFELEKKLEFMSNFGKAKDMIEQIQSDVLGIKNINDKRINSREISIQVNSVMSKLEDLKNNI